MLESLRNFRVFIVSREKAKHPEGTDLFDEICAKVEHIGDENAKLRAEVERLAAWLSKIDGGDNPCTDEARLRQWAYEAITLGKSVED